MKKIETNIPGVWIIEPQVFGDHRGYFMETYSTRAFHDMGLDAIFVQDNQSFTTQKGTLRGIHFQNAPMAQAKLVRVTRGAVMDVAVDLRKGSPTYLQWTAAELSAENKRMLYIPRGFGHGFKTLTDDVEFCYKVDTFTARNMTAASVLMILPSVWTGAKLWRRCCHKRIQPRPYSQAATATLSTDKSDAVRRSSI